MNKICTHCYISGQVQGVFYRAATRDEARKLGLSGWVKNLADGRVEALVCGEQESVKKLVLWMSKGPAGAKVSSVVTKAQDWQDNLVEFDIIK